ncbi:hypothetical protein CSUI_007710 [Cystoisospora suis]|uniref:Uncharacterized protein n=1 Tax=Cystoisospora suis TaxID=483139 RepID=A0A2C6KPR0_9APIC|nr:hypothetical protein CSUI_007710 [Cystoisospora suis]
MSEDVHLSVFCAYMHTYIYTTCMLMCRRYVYARGINCSSVSVSLSLLCARSYMTKKSYLYSHSRWTVFAHWGVHFTHRSLFASFTFSILDEGFCH